jgi:hypothetical protein
VSERDANRGTWLGLILLALGFLTAVTARYPLDGEAAVVMALIGAFTFVRCNPADLT